MLEGVGWREWIVVSSFVRRSSAWRFFVALACVVRQTYSSHKRLKWHCCATGMRWLGDQPLSGLGVNVS